MPDDAILRAVDGVVETARDKLVDPVQKLARGLVYGLLGGVFLLTAFTVAGVGAFRALSVYLPEDVWAAHLVVGGIFVLSGLFLWTKRR